MIVSWAQIRTEMAGLCAEPVIKAVGTSLSPHASSSAVRATSSAGWPTWVTLTYRPAGSSSANTSPSPATSPAVGTPASTTSSRLMSTVR